jgi:dienelactone hydrolase
MAEATFDACVIVHPGPLEFPKDFERVTSAARWYFQCAEWDQWFPDEQRDEAKKYLESKGVSVKLSVYEKTIHGFAVSYPRGGVLTFVRRGGISLMTVVVEWRG